MVPIISRFTSASNSRMPLLADYHKNTLKKQSYCTTNFFSDCSLFTYAPLFNLIEHRTKMNKKILLVSDKSFFKIYGAK